MSTQYLPHDFSFSKAVIGEQGWYKGDFHVHSNCSDGFYPVGTVNSIAEAEGLDFHVITDHNTLEAFKALKGDHKTLVIPGIEVTFRRGHFNLFGLCGWEDWMEGIVEIFPTKLDEGDDDEVAALVEQLSSEGKIVSINHPCMPPWAWEFGPTDLRNLTCIEIMCDLYWPGSVTANPDAINMWIAWLNAGHRITGIGGSDYHYPPRPEHGLPGERLGMPTTWVYARELSINGILEAIHNGRAYVTKGPEVDFTASFDGSDYRIGDDLGEIDGEIAFTATASKFPNNLQANLIKCGEVIAVEQLKGESAKVKFNDKVDPDSSIWYGLSITNQEDEIITITNPIYAGPVKSPELNLYSDFLP